LAKEIAAELRAKFDLNVLKRTANALGPRCADIDPAERGRVDRIGIPQRKKDWIADRGNGSFASD